MLTPEQRYLTDPVFHRMVSLMLQQLAEAQMTATEIREAAILAAQIHEQTLARVRFAMPNVFGHTKPSVYCPICAQYGHERGECPCVR